MDPELQRQINEELIRLSDTVNRLVPNMVLMNQTVEKNLRQSGITQRDLDQNVKATNDARIATEQETIATRASTESAKKNKEGLDQLGSAYQKAKDSAQSLGTALLSTDANMSKYSAGLAGLGGAVADAAKPFGLLGGVVGLVAKGFSLLVGRVLEGNDQLVKAYDSLSKIGTAGDLTTSEIEQMGRSAGYSRDRLEKLTPIFSKLGPDLLALGTTAADGAKSFGKLIQADEDVLQQYRRLGITQEQLNENQADYVKLQTASGLVITQRMVQEGQLRKASLEYTDNLLQLASLSGEDVESVKKRIEANRADISLQMKLMNLQSREEEARNKKDTAEVERLTRERQAIEAMSDIAANSGLSAERLAGFNQMLATGNFTELSKSFAVGAPEILNFIEEVKRGTRSATELPKLLADAQKRNIDQFGETIAYGREGLGKNIGVVSSEIQKQAKYTGQTTEEYLAARKKEKEDLEKAKKEGRDKTLDLQAGNEATQRAFKISADIMTDLIKGPVNGALELFQDMVRQTAKVLAKFVNFMGGPDYEDLFKTADELKQEETENKERLKTLNEELEKAATKVGAAGGQGVGADSGLPGMTTEETMMGLSVHDPYRRAFEEREKLQARQKNIQKELVGRGAKPGSVPAGGGAAPAGGGTGAAPAGGGTGAAPAGGSAPLIEGSGKPADARKILDFIAGLESRGNYDIMVGGKNENLTSLTLSQVLDLQTKYARTAGSSAAGRYQIIKGTLLESMKATGVSENDKFDASTQDKLAMYLLNKRGYSDFKSQKITIDQFADNLAAEWAALPLKSGKSKYEGDKVGNKSLTTREEFLKALQAKAGGIASGPMTGYPVVMHGNELIKPLDPNSILEKLATTPATSSPPLEKIGQEQPAEILVNIKDMQLDFYNQMLAKFDAMIDKLDTSNNIQDRILKYSSI